MGVLAGIKCLKALEVHGQKKKKPTSTKIFKIEHEDGRKQ